MEILWTIIGMLLYAIACYGWGYHRGAETMRYSYDEGYNQALKDRDYEEMLRRDAMVDEIYKEDQAREMIKQVEELFEDNTIDCGEY